MKVVISFDRKSPITARVVSKKSTKIKDQFVPKRRFDHTLMRMIETNEMDIISGIDETRYYLDNGDEISLCNKTKQFTYFALGKKYGNYLYESRYNKIEFKRGR